MNLRDHLQSTLGGSYTIERELHGGGMSRAYVADETALGRRVVVKVLDPELAASLSAERFAREIRVTARLQHPNIVPVLSTGESGGIPYYTMPYIEGASLAERFGRGRMPLAEAVPVLRDVARALAYAHGQGIIHRDVKPANVLLSEGTGVVTDFGIAKAISDSRTRSERPGTALTIAGTSVGTPAYMAPEQALGDPVDARTDVYAWGVMAYEALSGAHPFEAPLTAQQLIAAQISQRPPPLASVAPDVPETLARLVDRCLEKDPRARPPSAHVIVAELDASVSSPRAAAATSRWSRMRVAIAAAALLGVAALGVDAITRGRASAAQLDPTLVTVMPFRVASADLSIRHLREGVLDLLSAQLGGTPRTVDTRTTLAAWQRAGGADGRDLTLEEASRVATALGAGRLMLGEIVAINDRLTISATIYATHRNVERARASASGSVDALAMLLDSVVSRLLVLDAGEGEQRALSLARIPLPALQAYLAGQAALRLGHYDQAADHYARALETDSTFALAGLALDETGGWTFDPRAARGLAVARAHRDRLGARDRLILEAKEIGTVSTTEADAFAAHERLVAAAPDVPLLWHLLADRYVHYGAALLGEPEAMRRATANFERALELDSSYVPALEHLPMLYALAGDSIRGRGAYERLLQDTLAVYHHALRYSFAPSRVQQEDALERMEGSGAAAAASHAVGQVMVMGDRLEGLPRLVEIAGRRATGQRLQTLYAALLEIGRPAAAAAAATGDAVLARQALFAATWVGGDSATAAALYRREVPHVRAGYPAAPADRPAWVTTAYDVAAYDLSRGDTIGVRRVIEAFRSIPMGEAVIVERVRPSQLALILEAQLAALARHPGTRTRIESLDSMLLLGPRGLRVANTGNLVVARLWQQAGQEERALAALYRWHFGYGFPQMMGFSTFLRERARLLATLGRREEALRTYRHFVDMRAAAEPVLQPEVDAVRLEMQRLEVR